jgi:4-hydroxy-tetrahydrodipicolinate reductase
MMKVAIAGSSGRMGRALIESVLNASDLRLRAALEISGSSFVGQDAGEFCGMTTGIVISDEIESAISGCDVLIDFTRPEGTLKHLALCRDAKLKMVIGTTGLSDSQKRELAQAAQEIAIVFAPNMSAGVNLSLKLIELAAKVFSDYDVEIIEAHHRHKVDAPSGTSLKLGEIVAQARGAKLQEVAVYSREGAIGERQAGSIGFAAVRGGDIVGEHTVMFAGAGERLEITHRASSRATFAQGALRAARFLANKKSGLYDMQDVLGLR